MTAATSGPTPDPQQVRNDDVAVRLSKRVSPAYAALAAQLRTERERQGLTQRELARHITDYSTALCNWESGRSVPGVAPLAKWAAGLGFELALVPVGTDVGAVLDGREQLAADRDRLAARVAELEGKLAEVLTADGWAEYTADPDQELSVEQRRHFAALMSGGNECDCSCQLGQPCLCSERDCYCGPCPVCGDSPAEHAAGGAA